MPDNTMTPLLTPNSSPPSSLPHRSFLLNREQAVQYLNQLDRVFVCDGYAGWDPEVSCTGVRQCAVSACMHCRMLGVWLY